MKNKLSSFILGVLLISVLGTNGLELLRNNQQKNSMYPKAKALMQPRVYCWSSAVRDPAYVFTWCGNCHPEIGQPLGDYHKCRPRQHKK